MSSSLLIFTITGRDNATVTPSLMHSVTALPQPNPMTSTSTLLLDYFLLFLILYVSFLLFRNVGLTSEPYTSSHLTYT